MHLSKEIQAQLDKLNSGIKLGYTIDGYFPDRYAFIHDRVRKFSAEFAATEEEFSFVLYEWKNEGNYNHCFARGIIKDIVRLAQVIDLWVNREQSADDIKLQFDELELFRDFEFRNPDAAIDAAWTKIKNMFFKDLTYWQTPEWNERYAELLQKAKEHPAFQKLFPFTSHYWLRFSVDKNKNEMWELYLDISPELPCKTYVSDNDGKKFFDTVNEALDFYSQKLRMTKPLRRNT